MNNKNSNDLNYHKNILLSLDLKKKVEYKRDLQEKAMRWNFKKEQTDLVFSMIYVFISTITILWVSFIKWKIECNNKFFYNFCKKTDKEFLNIRVSVGNKNQKVEKFFEKIQNMNDSINAYIDNNTILEQLNTSLEAMEVNNVFFLCAAPISIGIITIFIIYFSTNDQKFNKLNFKSFVDFVKKVYGNLKKNFINFFKSNKKNTDT